MDLKQIGIVLDELEHDKGIPRDKILQTIEMALAAAYKRDYGGRGQVVRATFDIENGKTSFALVKLVVNESMLKTDEEIAEEDASGASEKEFEENTNPEEPKKVRYNPERHVMLDEAKKVKKDV